MISVLIADDQDLVRLGLRTLLDSEEGLVVAGEAADGLRAVELACELRPDVVLMDIRMPGIDGIEATRRIAADPRTRQTRVVVLTTFELDEYVVAAIRAGASGFLGKGVAPEALLEAIRTVAAGDQLLSPAATRALIERVLTRPDPASGQDVPGMADLTDREREVTRLVGGGLSNIEIGERLYISPLTAKTHVNRAMMKTGSRDRAQLVVLAYETGLVSPGEQ